MNEFILNSTWAPTILSEPALFLAYCILTLIIEAAVFLIYTIIRYKNLKETLEILLVVLIANFLSFIVGYILTFR